MNEITPIPMPVVHLNGSNICSLFGQNRRAHDAIEAAIEAVQKAAPHGRDYYPAGEGAFRLALRGHTSRLVMLEQIKAELEAIITHLGGY